jgi:hypothetical protein
MFDAREEETDVNVQLRRGAMMFRLRPDAASNHLSISASTGIDKQCVAERREEIVGAEAQCS